VKAIFDSQILNKTFLKHDFSCIHKDCQDTMSGFNRLGFKCRSQILENGEI